MSRPLTFSMLIHRSADKFTVTSSSSVLFIIYLTMDERLWFICVRWSV